MYQLKTIKIFFTAILVLCIFFKSANAILSENTPKEYQLTPVYKEQTFPNKKAPEKDISNQKPQQDQTLTRPKTEKEKNRRVKQGDYRTEITVTSERTKIEPVLQEEPQTELSKVIKDLETIIAETSYYRFAPSKPEDDFITLSALDFIVTETERRLSDSVSGPENIPEKANCQTTFELCNGRLVGSLSERLEKIDFIKFSQQALGENVNTPKIELNLPSPLTDTDVKFAFNDLNETNSKIENYYSRPSDFSNQIRKILKNKQNIFTETKGDFVNNIKILKSQLYFYGQSDQELLFDVTRKKESNLTIDVTRQVMSQIDEFIKFIEQKKIIIDNQIVSNTSDTSITPELSIEKIKREASGLSTLYSLIEGYTEENTKLFEKDINLSKKISERLENYAIFQNQINSLQFSDDVMTEENISQISELQTALREERRGGILLSNEILNSKEGIQLFNQTLPALADLNAQLEETQRLFPYQSLNLILIEATERLNKILKTLSDRNVDALKQPINENTLQFFPSLVPENRAMQEIMTHIFSGNSSENEPPNITLSDAGINLDNNGFYKYEADSLKMNSLIPEQHALQILGKFNYLSQ